MDKSVFVPMGAKPACLLCNIMIADPTSDYPVGRAVVMDWGIAKELKDADEAPLTEVWTVVGTPQYCAPEQMRPFDQVQASADIYSLGMVIYEMCTGRQFFAGLDKKSIIRKVCDEAEENEPHFHRPVDMRFHALVRKTIAKSRARRYQRVENFLQDLENCRAAVRGPAATTNTLTSSKPGEFFGVRNSPRAEEVYAQTRGAVADADEPAYATLREETDPEQAQGVVARGEGTEDSVAAAFPQAVRGEGEYIAAQASGAEAASPFTTSPWLGPPGRAQRELFPTLLLGLSLARLSSPRGNTVSAQPFRRPGENGGRESNFILTGCERTRTVRATIGRRNGTLSFGAGRTARGAERIPCSANSGYDQGRSDSPSSSIKTPAHHPGKS